MFANVKTWALSNGAGVAGRFCQRWVLGLILAVAGCGRIPEPPNRAREPGGERPNIVVIVVDDLRWDEFHAGGHPYLETPNIDRLAAEGALFVNSFHAFPLCSPNRASLLTGQFPSRHGIIDNTARDLASHHLETFNLPMQTAGYRTAFLGKWHMGNDPTPRPGWDYWVAMPGQGHATNPDLFENGALHKVHGYTTDLLTERAVSFIRREQGHPFLLYFAHKAVHPDIVQRDDGSLDQDSDRGYIPAPRHEGRYRGGCSPAASSGPRSPRTSLESPSSVTPCGGFRRPQVPGPVNMSMRTPGPGRRPSAAAPR